MQRELISYGRFSSKPQEKGDSTKRQRDAYYGLLERYKGKGLIESARYGFGKLFDNGLSAFYALHLEEGGHLAAFLELCKAGTFRSGQVLGIEHLSRLARIEPDLAQALISKIVREYGIPIAVYSPDMWIDVAFLNSPMYGMLGMLLQQNYEESRRKKEVGKHNWQSKRDEGKVRTTICPSWLIPNCKVGDKISPDNWTFNPVLKPLLLDAIDRAINGDGADVIRREMGLGENLKGLSTIFRQRTLIGEFADRERNGKTKGKPQEAIANYYPALINLDRFHKLQNAIDSRKTVKGRRGDMVTNLFADKLVDSKGGAFWIRAVAGRRVKGGGRILERVLMEKAYRLNLAERTLPLLRYDLVERALLQFVQEVKPQDLLPTVKPDAAIEALEGRIADYRSKVKEFDALMMETKGGAALLGQKIVKLGVAIEQAEAELEALKRATVSTDTERLTDAKSVIEMLDKATGQDLIALRAKLRGLILTLVEKVVVTPTSKTEARLAVYMSTGLVKFITVNGNGSIGYILGIGHTLDGIQDNPPYGRKTA